MLGIILILFIGKYYYELAQDYYKHRWLYGILGIAVYYVGTAVGGFILGVASELFELNLDWENTFTLSLMVLPFGILFSVIIYLLIKRQWQKTIPIAKDEIKDIGNIDKKN
ncbi:hypothetical protein [Algibacter aquimarinus]|uniref:MFS transporter n=1 Tax=Algibacter aquimarinus TaxID=1136748 RepID=A0ABP9H380_9FLAO